jgi:hypothetical protein
MKSGSKVWVKYRSSSCLPVRSWIVPRAAYMTCRAFAGSLLLALAFRYAASITS